MLMAMAALSEANARADAQSGGGELLGGNWEMHRTVLG
jgi:hypothetical protein